MKYLKRFESKSKDAWEFSDWEWLRYVKFIEEIDNDWYIVNPEMNKNYSDIIFEYRHKQQNVNVLLR